MSRLETLIEKLCPDGVPYMKLTDSTEMKRGTSATRKNLAEGSIPVISGGKEPAYYCNTYNREGETITVAGSGAGAGYVQYWDQPIFLCDAFSIKGKEDLLLTKYVYYYLSNNQEEIYATKKGGGVPHVHISSIDSMSIPVPPLEVQREVVRMLDCFTLLTAELIAELKAELTARKEQYEYYREKSFCFDDVPINKLSDCFPFIRNGFVGTVTPYFTDEENGVRYLEGTNIHNGIVSDNEVLYVTKEFHEKHKKSELKNDDILMVQSGHIGECAVVGGKYEGCNCHALIIMSNNGFCNPYYFVHYFHTAAGFKALNRAITGGTIKHVLAGKMKNVVVPVPSIEVQNKIADTLNKFDKCINDENESLIAEIEARQKQYEYYRNKLLTFKVLEV